MASNRGSVRKFLAKPVPIPTWLFLFMCFEILFLAIPVILRGPP